LAGLEHGRVAVHLAAHFAFESQPDAIAKAFEAESGNGDGREQDPRALMQRIVQIRDCTNPIHGAYLFMQHLKAGVQQQELTASAVISALSGTRLAQALDVVIAGNDGRCGLDVLAVWIEAGRPLPKIQGDDLRPLRLEATLDEEEQHPTGVTLGFGAVH
jgi:hypothetical protein